MLRLGIDLGNSKVKVVSESKTFSFNALIESGYNEFNRLNSTDKIKVEFNKTTYTIGSGEENLNKNKYFNDFYKIMLLTAITKILDDNIKQADTIVVVSLPVDVYKNKELREEIKQQLLSLKQQKIIVDNQEYTINIVDVDIWIEGGIVISMPEFFNEHKALIHDIGGYTQDTLEFRYGELGKSRTEKRGIITLQEEILSIFKQDFNIELDTNSKKEFIDALLNNKDFNLTNKVISLEKYYKYVEKYVSDIFNSLEKNFNTDDKEIIFIGGGSIKLSDVLIPYKKYYNLKVLKDAEFSNAKSNLEIAKNIIL